MRRHLISPESLPADLRPQSWARRTALVACGALALTTTGVASAAWTSSGTGAGTATAGTAQELTVSAVTTGVLYPASPAISVAARVTVVNPNPYRVRVDTLAYGAELTEDKGGCDATNADVTFVPKAALGWEVPAGGQQTFDLPAAVTMGSGSAASCMGATFSKSFTVTGESY